MPYSLVFLFLLFAPPFPFELDLTRSQPRADRMFKIDATTLIFLINVVPTRLNCKGSATIKVPRATEGLRRGRCLGGRLDPAALVCPQPAHTGSSFLIVDGVEDVQLVELALEHRDLAMSFETHVQVAVFIQGADIPHHRKSDRTVGCEALRNGLGVEGFRV